MIAITCRKLCPEPLPDRIARIADANPGMIILREKDLGHDALLELASECLRVCEERNVPLSVNTDLDVARELDICRVHLPLQAMRDAGDLSDFSMVGVSVHSPEEAAEAEGLGADYLIAGHIFPTACKIGAPRGTDYLRDVCESADIPVFGVGGITPGNYPEVIRAGAAGAAVMSSVMTSDDPGALVRALSGRP